MDIVLQMSSGKSAPMMVITENEQQQWTSLIWLRCFHALLMSWYVRMNDCKIYVHVLLTLQHFISSLRAAKIV